MASIYACKNDVARFSAMAEKGEIDQVAVLPLAVASAATRKLKIALGDRYRSLETFAVASVYADADDIARFAAMADKGYINEAAVLPLAVAYAAARTAQIALGEGHQPLEAFASALPARYVNNWAVARTSHVGHLRSK